MEGRVVAGRYEVVQQLNAGGMGIICEAVHRDTGKRVALKLVLRGQFFDEKSAAWTKRFRREARAIGALETPHVVQVYDAGTDTDTGQPFIAMELLKGVDLSKLLKGTGPLQPETAVKIVCQACVGVVEAHHHGVLHRDLKPSNLFLSIQDHRVTVKVLDFGIAKITADPKLSRITLTGQLIGTPAYASPEQLRGDTVDERSDVWSLGAVLYKALTGSVPHDNVGGLVDLVMQVTREPARPIAKRAPWVPPAIAAIAERALQIAPANRYPNVSAMLDDLQRLVPNIALAENELLGMRPEDVSSAWAATPRRSSPTAAQTVLTTSGITTASRSPATLTQARSWGFFFLAFAATLVVLTAGAFIYLKRPIPKRLDRIVSTPVIPELEQKSVPRNVPDRRESPPAESARASEPAPSASTRIPSAKAGAPAPPKASPKVDKDKPPTPPPALTLEPIF